MDINIHNYEAYFLDYLEGNADERVIAAIELFLADHPELRNELTSFQTLEVTPEKTEFAGKNGLYKFKFEDTPVNENTFSDFCIAFHEKLLSETKRKELSDFLESHPGLQNDFNLFSKTYLSSDNGIKYPYRSVLYKQKPKARILHVNFKYLAVAASIILFISIYFTFRAQIHTKGTIEIPQQNIASTAKNPNANHPVTKKVVDIPQKGNHPVKQMPKISQNEQPKEVVAEEISRDEAPEKINPVEVNQLPVNGRPNTREIAIQLKNESITFPDFPKNIDPYAESEKQKFQLLSLIEAGVNKFGEYTETNIKLSHQQNNTGKITGLTFESGIFEFHRKKNR